MSDSSKIEWTEATWSPTTGCDRISPGCDNCYALTLARRLKAMGSAKYQADGDPRTSGPGFGLTVHEDALTLPLRWRKPRRIFVNSMSDLFHARVTPEFTARVWAVMAMTPHHAYQVLTKRPERARSVLGGERFARAYEAELDQRVGDLARFGTLRARDWAETFAVSWPPPNVHLGTSIEMDGYARRADDLRETPAAVRFLSLEPLLGPLPSLDLTGIDWAIIGGESGPGSRPMDLGWARDLIGRCREAGTAVFVKQLGSVAGRELGAGPKGGDWDAWPEDLRIRDFPAVAETAVAS